MVISTRIHGILDYVVSALVVALPWIFDFARGGAETWVPVLLGTSSIMYSLLTNYEYGVFKLIPMPSHLLLDVVSGIMLTLSPWLFDFQDEVHWPHLTFGILEVLVVSVSSSVPGERKTELSLKHKAQQH
jgi:hypothetical protein